MTSSMLFGDRRMSSSRRSGMTVLGKVPKPINLPSKRLENHGADPSVEIVPKGTLSWGSRSSSASNAWGSPSLSPKADGGTSPSHLSGHLSPGSGTRPSTAGSDKGHEPSSNAWGSNSRPSSASGALTSNQTTLTSLRPRSADTRPGSSQLSRFAEHSDHPVAWSAPGTAEKLGMMSSKNDGFSLTSGDFPTLGSEKDNPGKSAEPQDHSSYSRPGSSSGRVAKETTGTYVVGEISENANVKSGTANSWKRENPSYNEDGGRHGMEKWQGNPHPYPSANVPPQHYDGWHGGPVNNPQGGVWYRGPPGAPYGAPIPPGGFPMEPFPYYPPGPPQIPPAAIANQQSIPPPGAGPRGHHPKNGDMYRPHMQDAYIRPGMPIRPGFYPGPVAFEGYYSSPRGYCNPNERDVPYVGMTAGPPVYNNYPSQSTHRPAISQGRPSGYGPPNPQLMSEQFESGHPPDSRGPYKVLLKQHDGWDRRNEEQRNEGAVTRLSTDASSLEREDHPRMLGAESDWISDHRKEGVRDQRKMVGEEAASRKFDNQGAASVPKKVMSPESLEQIKTVDVISMKKSDTEASGTPEVAQPLLDAAKDSSLIQKIEGLNAKARVSDGRSDTSSVSTREEQKNRFQVNAKTNNSVNEPVGGDIVNPERSHATESLNPSLEVGSTISISRRSNRAMHDDRSDHRGRGRFNNQEGEGWSKKSLVSEPTTVVSTARFEIPSNVHLHDHLVSTEAIEKPGSYPQGRCEEELATPMVDPNDSEAQRAKKRELAKQRTKQLQEEEEERTRRQMAKARAKLEELNRRTQVESSNQKIEGHSSGPIQIKQEESQTAGEPLIGGRKSALGSNLDGASRINESSTGKAEKSTVLASDLPSDTLKSVCKEPVLMHDESMPKLKEVIVANVVDRNNAPQAHESNITRVKQAPKQRQNNQLERKPTGKFTSTSTDDATKCQTDSVVDVSKSLGVVANETASSSESSQTELTSHPRKKNYRNGKNKQKTESTSTTSLTQSLCPNRAQQLSLGPRPNKPLKNQHFTSCFFSLQKEDHHHVLPTLTQEKTTLNSLLSSLINQKNRTLCSSSSVSPSDLDLQKSESVKMLEKVDEFDMEKIIEEFEAMTKDAERVQRKTLKKILEENGSVEYLQGFGLNGKTDPESFKACVPLVTHQDMYPYIQRIADGDSSPILTGKPIPTISLSSGTTQGRPKFVPFNDELMETTMQIFQTSFAFRNREYPIANGKALQFIYGSKHLKTRGGLATGTATTNVYRNQKFKNTMKSVQSQCCSPDEVIFGADFQQSLYCHLLCGLIFSDEVQLISSTFAHSIVLAFGTFELLWEELCANIRDGVLSDRITVPSIRSAVSKLLTPNPELADLIHGKCSGLSNWYGLIPALFPYAKYIYGIMTGSMEPYLKKLRHYAGELPLVSADYGASEGWVGANVNPTLPAELSTFAVLPNIGYFEFIPMKNNRGEQPVGLTEVKVGEEYEVVLTNVAGLYRYRLGDVVKVVGFYNSTPELKFVCRSNLLLTINIDKNTEKDLQLSVEEAGKILAAEKLEVVDFSSHVDLSTDPGHYVIFLELNGEPSHEVLRECCNCLDKSFVDPGYMSSRKVNTIGPLELRILRKGTFQEILNYYIAQGTVVNQFKTPRCVGPNNTKVLQLLCGNVVRSFFSTAYN